MQENEFEKQVKKLMEELHFSPSAPVWEKIRKHIAKKRRRGWPIFFLFITVAILSSYFFYADIKHPGKNIYKNYNTSNKIIPGKESADSVNKERNRSKDLVAITKQATQQLSTAKNLNTKNAAAKQKNFKKDENVFVYQSSVKKNNPKQIIDTTTHKNSFTEVEIPNQKINTAILHTDSNYMYKNDDLKNNADSSINISNETVKNNLAAGKKNQDKKLNKNKWQFGISALYGRGNIASSFFNLNTNKSVSATPGVNIPGTTLISSRNVLKDPYYTNDAYNTGIIVKRKISKQSSLNTGLNFIHLSSKNNTAISVDSSLIPLAANLQPDNSAGYFYRIGTVKTYTNSFNFIEVPLTFQSNLFHIKNFAVSYNAGASLMRLVSSKSLIYNNYNNSFFSDDALLRRTHFQLTAGLNLQLNTKNKSSILLGPHFEYSLSPYLKNNNYNNLHYMYYGLRASWIFGKK